MSPDVVHELEAPETSAGSRFFRDADADDELETLVELLESYNFEHSVRMHSADSARARLATDGGSE